MARHPLRILGNIHLNHARTGKRTFKFKEPARRIYFSEGYRLHTKILLEKLVWKGPAGRGQFLVAHCLQPFKGFWGKDFFPAKGFLSLPRSTMVNALED
jgi:hypothetical protein